MVTKKLVTQLGKPIPRPEDGPIVRYVSLGNNGAA